MKPRLCPLLPMIVPLALLCLAAGPPDQALLPGERYRYEAVPLGAGDANRESIEMEIREDRQGLRYRSRTRTPRGREEIEIEADPAGIVQSARQTITGEHRSEGVTLRRKAGGIRLIGDRGENAERTFAVPLGKTLAVDGSLLLLIRRFPFGQRAVSPLFMVDFSGASVTVELSEAGLETVTVPAGTFACYRMEVTVDIPILHPRLLYWVTKRPPHFLVRSVGKRGPFTPSYETTLVSAEPPPVSPPPAADPAAQGNP